MDKLDLRHPSNRYRDEPEQKDYDWGKWGMNITAGMAVVAGLTVLAVAGGGLISAGAAKVMGTSVFLTGSMYVAEQAVSDAVSRCLGDEEQYVRKALVGSVVSFLSGASGLLMQGTGLGKVLSPGFGEGFLGSVVTQALLNEDGEINWELAMAEGAFSAAVTGLAWKAAENAKGVKGGSDALGGGTDVGNIVDRKSPDGHMPYKDN